MSSSYFQHFVFEWDTCGIPTDSNGRFSPETQINVVNKIESEKRKVVVLTSYIQNALRAAKVSFGNPSVVWVRVMLTTNPRPIPYYDPEPFLYVDVEYDPRNFLKPPKCNEEIGSLYVDLTKQAVSKLKSEEGFPVDVILEACDKFVAAGYQFPFRAGEAKLPGTKLKGRVTVVVSGLHTIRYFSVVYHKKEIFRHEVSRYEGGEMQFSRHFSGFEMNEAVVTILGGHVNPISGKMMVPNVDVDLADYPEALALLKKHS